MKRTHLGLLAGASALAASACHLAELSEKPPGDAATMTDAGAPADVVEPGPADAAPIDAFDDPTIPPGSPLGSCDSRTWVASASSSDGNNPPAYAIDGLLPTRWSSGAAQFPGQYLQIDFGGFVMIDQVVIEPVYELDGHGDYPRGVEVLASYDGVDFSRRLHSQSFAADPGTVTLGFGAHAARQLRVQLTQGGVVSWFTIHELRLGCSLPDPGATPDAGVDPLPPDGGVELGRAGWSASAGASSVADPVAHAFDGDPATRWASGKAPQFGDEFFRLDLGAERSIHEVRLEAAAPDFPSAYALELSSDDLSYTRVAIGLGAVTTTIRFATQSARYLKVRQIGSGYDHWWGINEIHVIE